jgi:hypothetical protein
MRIRYNAENKVWELYSKVPKSISKHTDRVVKRVIQFSRTKQRIPAQEWLNEHNPVNRLAKQEMAVRRILKMEKKPTSTPQIKKQTKIVKKIKSK